MSMCPGRPALLALFDDKFEGLRQRGIAAIAQLSDEDVNWRPNEESNSVVNLVVHMAGNLHQTIESAIDGQPDQRNRDLEFNTREVHTAASITAVFDRAMTSAKEVVGAVTPADLTRVVSVRGRDTTVLAVLLTVVTHLSEHLGQLMYIAKMIKGPSYQVLSVAHRRST